MSTIFISRDLEDTSPLHNLSHHGFKVTGDSLLQFTYLPFELPSSFDWVFFYSQHGVKAFFAHVSVEQVRSKSLAAFGPKTADAVEAYLPVHFIGNGRGAQTGPAFDWVARDREVVFARAENSLLSVQQQVKNLTALDCVVYRNEPKEKMQLAHHDIAVLTSPLNARSYGQWAAPAAERIIAIGQSTRSVLLEMGMQNVLVPTQSTEESIVELLLQLPK